MKSREELREEWRDHWLRKYTDQPSSMEPCQTDLTGEYDPYAAEFDRGWDAATDQLAGDYKRGFTDALLICFIFFAFGAAITATVSAVFA